MIIDFLDMEDTAINKFYGGEKDTLARMFTDEYNRIMLNRLEPGASIGLHKQENSSEIVYILQGAGKAMYDDCEEILTSGMCHYCPKDHTHSIINDGNEDLIFFTVVPQQ